LQANVGQDVGGGGLEQLRRQVVLRGAVNGREVLRQLDVVVEHLPFFEWLQPGADALDPGTFRPLFASFVRNPPKPTE
jgi:hypothetical protein